MPAFDVLKSGDFRTFWTVKAVNEISRRMELLALGYLVLRMTDSPFQVGLIAVARMIRGRSVMGEVLPGWLIAGSTQVDLDAAGSSRPQHLLRDERRGR